MLDEIPALKPLKRTIVISAHPTISESLLTFNSQISFKPLADFLKEKRSLVSESKDWMYSRLIKELENKQSLLEPIKDMHLIDDQATLLDLLTTSLFPVIGEHDNNNFALSAPHQYKIFYYSDKFKKLFIDTDEQYIILPNGLDKEELKSIQCAAIYDHVLEKFYGMHLNEIPQLIYPITDPETDLLRYFRIRYDRRFIDLNLKGKLPPIQDCGVCMNTFRILDLEKQLTTMPLDLFQAEGFGLWLVDDVTQTESLELLKRALLRETCGMGVMDELKKAIKALVGLMDIEVGLMPFVSVNGQIVLDTQASAHSLVAQQWADGTPYQQAEFRQFIGFLKERPVPMPITNLSQEMVDMAPFLTPIFAQGIRSYIYYPMLNGDGLIGYLELACPRKNALTQQTVIDLEPAIPLLSLAVLNCRDEFNARIEKVIREKFTALQQSVEWKFAEVAWTHIHNNDKSACTVNVVFDNVYPLYGAVDIRNSSLERGLAIQKDLKEHLLLVATILTKLQATMQLPLLEGLEFKNESLRQSLEDTMSAEEETCINDFLNNEVEPLFNHLQKTNEQAEKVINEYFNLLNQNDSRLYQNRQDYEKSVMAINEAVLAYIEEEEESIQRAYPHYFEKYRTDGIEYNIYIGQAIAPTIPFDMFYLKNIRLWQLKTMAGTAQVTQRLLSELKVPLHTTQLILIHSQPISISFRRDERRFDVEGSYNIRYEIIKKRLDKVHIKGTQERLTQPGKIAIVYSNQKEVTEYEEYIRFLQKKDILKPDIESLELEELQGVKGLKAIRVAINMVEEETPKMN